MAEYISKQDVIDYLNGYLHSLGEDADTLFNRGQRRALTNSIQDILAVKAVEVQPEKCGKWLHDRRTQWKCSECGNFLDFDGLNCGRGTAFYCPNCGARMDGDTE